MTTALSDDPKASRGRTPRPSLLGVAVMLALLLAMFALQEWVRDHSVDTGRARYFVYNAVGVSLPHGVQAIHLTEGRYGKTTFTIDEQSLDSVEAAIGLDSTWTVAEWGGGTGFTRTDSTGSGVFEQLYQRWNRLYQVTRFD